MKKILSLKKVNLLGPILLALLIAIPLYPKFPFQNVENTYVAIRIEDFLVAACLFVWGLYQLKNGFPVLKLKITKIFLLYWAAGLISVLSAIFISDIINPKLALFHFVRRIEYMSLFFVAYDAMKKLKLREVALAISFTSLLIFLYAMGQRYYSFPVVSTMNEEFSKGQLLILDKWTRISSTFAGHYDLAVWSTLVLSITPIFLVILKRKWERVVILLTMAINFYLLIMTASRVSFVAYLIGITLALLLLKKYLWLPLVLVISIAFGFSSAQLSVRLKTAIDPISSKIASIESWQKIVLFTEQSKDKYFKKPTPTPTTEPDISVIPSQVASDDTTPSIQPGKTTPTPKEGKIIYKDGKGSAWPSPEEAKLAAERSSSIRFDVEWPRAVSAFKRNPLVGSGYSFLGLATDNDYLRSLGEVGILGTLTFLLIHLHLLLTSAKNYLSRNNKNSVISAGLIAGLVSFLANAIFIDVFEASKVAFYFWMIMGILYYYLQTNEIHEKKV
jgi:hypothetical protein